MKIRTPRELGAVIRERRKRLGLDQASLARSVGVSRQWIVGMEAGKARAELTLVLRTLDALDLRLDVSDGEARALPGPRRGVRDDEPRATPGTDVPTGAVDLPDIDAIVKAARRPAGRT